MCYCASLGCALKFNKLATGGTEVPRSVYVPPAGIVPLPVGLNLTFKFEVAFSLSLRLRLRLRLSRLGLGVTGTEAGCPGSSALPPSLRVVLVQ
jgi:hypothetical protein